MSSLKEVSISAILGESSDGKRGLTGGGVRSLVLSFVRRNLEGITVEMVAEAAAIGTSRARQLLKELCREREIYERKVPGIKAHLYYPNGRLIHKYLQDKRELGSQIFRVSFHEGRKHPRIQLQERTFTLLDGERVEGSVFVDLPQAPLLLEFLEDMLARFDGYEKSKEVKQR